jgi:hypothetical protein
MNTAPQPRAYPNRSESEGSLGHSGLPSLGLWLTRKSEKCRATGQKLVGGDEDDGGTKDQSTSQARCSQTSNSAASRH